ncbi:magnesium/cobalt transport protein CorA [Chitinivorax tropicus]|uniref:Magnesium/cobalt transport protein CorA n=1 Tax=Chitinivorax tropicus TaxID=714531 RepID=A0A840MLL4_9PROT|nr:CorA family divalent cation transporter [Chitinivorax tropicus]MBB5019300.1 magnesium/cobalt transport protein CorA [Chitinivorax tropicus]
MRIREVVFLDGYCSHPPVRQDASTADLEALLASPIHGQDCQWIDLEEAGEATLQILDILLGMPEGSMMAFHGGEGGACRFLPHAALFHTKRMFYHFETERCTGRPLTIVFLGNRLVSIHPITLARTVNHVFNASQARGDEIFQHGVAALFSIFLDELLEDYKPVLEDWRNELDAYERDCLNAVNESTLVQILRFKTLVTQLRQAMNVVFRDQRRFLNHCPERILSGISRDRACEANQRFELLLDEIESIRLHTASAYQVYAAAQSLDMTRASNHLNKVMERLAVVTSIFMPLTFIVGVYGMNIPDMPEVHFQGFYYVIWAVMLGIAAGLLWFFRRKGWF